MTRSNWILWAVLVAFLPATACITIVSPSPPATPSTPPSPPVIDSFAVEPSIVVAGEQATLTWQVSGATSVSIEPDIGKVGFSGSVILSPVSTTTYTLTASNEAGDVTASAKITVASVHREPDLVVTDIWVSGAVVNYKIKNQGNADADPSWTCLYVNKLKEARGFVDRLKAGEEKQETFSNYEWKFPGVPGFPVSPGATGTINRFEVKACADIDGTVEESNEDNNCLVAIWGEKFTYDFVKNAHLAKWRSSAGDLKWPMVATGKGAAYLLYNTLVMCPEAASNGWIMGRFAEYYVKEFGQETTSREIEVPDYAKFVARVGFESGDVSSDGVRVALGYLDATGSLVLFPKMDVYSDGITRNYEIDLSKLAGTKTEFVLWVEAKGSPEGDCVQWIEPRIIQK